MNYVYLKHLYAKRAELEAKLRLMTAPTAICASG